MGLEYKPSNTKAKKKTFRSFNDMSREEKLRILTDKNYRPPAHSYKKSIINESIRLDKEKKNKDGWVKLAKKSKIYYVYALLLNGDNYYVGITGNVARRYEQHSKGKGSKWTAKHKPLCIIEQRCLGRMKMDEAIMVENEVFEEYYSSYGYRVRGGGKCRVNANW